MSGNTELEEQSEPFKYEMNLPVKSLNLIEHFKFETEDDFYDFLYEDFAMQIFGHSPSTEMNSFVVLNDLIDSTKGKYEFSIFSKLIVLSFVYLIKKTISRRSVADLFSF